MSGFARAVWDGWDRFWFTPSDVAPVAAIRICTGLLLFYVYAAAAPDVAAWLGPEAWVDAATVARLRAGAQAGTGTPDRWWGHSIWFYATSPWMLAVTYLAFLVSIACFTVGLYTRAATVAVALGHLSFVHRAYLGWSGMDTVLAMLVLYLCVAPSGAAFSLDRRLRGQRLAQHAWAATLAVRLIQVHMCVIYLFAGLGKLQGSRWWDGTAVWATLAFHEFAPVDITWLGYVGDAFCLLLSNVGVLLTLALEIGFVFLIWNPATRSAMLTLAVVMHAGIGLLMGMGAFGAAMLTGCLAFVDASRVRAVAGNAADGLGGPART
jgi:hypothetical protein